MTTKNNEVTDMLTVRIPDPHSSGNDAAYYQKLLDQCAISATAKYTERIANGLPSHKRTATTPGE